MWRVTGRLYAMMWHLHRAERPRLVSAIQTEGRKARLFHIKTRHALNGFLSKPGQLARLQG